MRASKLLRPLLRRRLRLLMRVRCFSRWAAGPLWVADSSPRWVAAVVPNVCMSGVRSSASLGGLNFFVGCFGIEQCQLVVRLVLNWSRPLTLDLLGTVGLAWIFALLSVASVSQWTEIDAAARVSSPGLNISPIVKQINDRTRIRTRDLPDTHRMP